MVRLRCRVHKCSSTSKFVRPKTADQRTKWQTAINYKKKLGKIIEYIKIFFSEFLSLFCRWKTHAWGISVRDAGLIKIKHLSFVLI